MSSLTRESYRELLHASATARRALPGRCYVDPSAFLLELDHVLRPGWHPVARWDDLPETGEYRAFDLFGEPLMLVRDKDARLRVFSRVCRHRGHKLVEGSGCAQNFICPYHRWTYDLDGQLRGAPLMSAVEGFDREEYKLPELQTETWQGWLLVSTDPRANSVAESLQELDDRLSAHRIDELTTACIEEFDSPWNWKVMTENFMESYHHLGPHKDSLERVLPARDTKCPKLDAPAAIVENTDVNGDPSLIVWHVFPTLLGFYNETGDFGAWYEMQIDRHDFLKLRIHILARPNVASDRDKVEALRTGTRQIHLEDIPICEAVQRGVAAELYAPGILSEHEQSLTRVHEYLAECLG